MKIRTAIANTLLCALSTPAVAQLPNLAGEVGAATQSAAQVQAGDAATAVQSSTALDANVNSQTQQANATIQAQGGANSATDKSAGAGVADVNAGINTNLQAGDKTTADAQLNANANVQAGANAAGVQANSATTAAAGTQATNSTATISSNASSGTAQPYITNYGGYDAATVSGVVGGQSSIMSSPVGSSGYYSMSGSATYPTVQTAGGMYSAGSTVSPVNYTHSTGSWTTGSWSGNSSNCCPQRRLLGRLFRLR